MRLATGDEEKKGVALASNGGSDPLCEKSTNNENQNRALFENRSCQDSGYFEIVARATNDAVRDWNVKTGALSWPQGLEKLLGYAPLTGQGTINFWQQRLHPEDRSHVAESIRAALTATSDHWSGEYRFRHADGHYLQ